jgi:hypothetical protein
MEYKRRKEYVLQWAALVWEKLEEQAKREREAANIDFKARQQAAMQANYQAMAAARGQSDGYMNPYPFEGVK